MVKPFKIVDTHLRFDIPVDQPQGVYLLEPRQELQSEHGDGLVAELEVAHLEELLQVRAKQLHDHGVELGAPRAARAHLKHLREARLQGNISSAIFLAAINFCRL